MASTDVNRILVLGSGMVAAPCLEYLSRSPRNRITLASRTLPTAEKLASKILNTRALTLDVTLELELDQHIAANDVVISLLPFTQHVAVIRSALKGGTHVVTTSYISPAMRALDEDARRVGITVLNEVGVDPGIDHLYAVKKINEVHAQGGKVHEFYSYCSGLPAPECADNPLGFKFSWSPRGALLSQRNSATYLKNGVVEEISSEDLMASAAPYHVIDGYDFVAYPNRDSVPFRDFYNIPEAHTIIRGSLRYRGNPAFVQALADLGWLEQDEKDWLVDGITWAEITQKLLAASSSDEDSLINKLKSTVHFANDTERERIIAGLRWIGLFSPLKAPLTSRNLLDTLCTRLSHLLSFSPGERDLVILQHKFVVEWLDGRIETSTSTLQLFGEPEGELAMSRAVGVTCGIATQLLLDGHSAIKKAGVWAPYDVEACEVIREVLVGEGISMVHIFV